MNNLSNLQELNLRELTSSDIEIINGGGIIQDIFFAIGAVFAAIVNDAERVKNGQPVKMPSGMSTMYAAHS